jgi:hypothetical protein
MELTPKTGLSSPMDLIPRGFLCWAQLTFRGMKVSPTTGSRYADLELTIAENQPYARKKIFTKVADPDYHENSEKYRQMGMTSLTRMIEAAGLVNPADGESYKQFSGRSMDAVMALLDRRFVAVKIKIEAGTGGYEDKNDVGDYLTPNPESQSHKAFLKLTSGDHGIPVAPRTGFGASPPAVAGGARAGGFQQSAPAVQQQPAATPAPAEARGFNPNAAPAFLKAGQS